MNKKLVELRNKSQDNIKNKLFEDYDKIKTYKDLLVITLKEFMKSMNRKCKVKDFNIKTHKFGDYSGALVFVYTLGEYDGFWENNIYACCIDYGSCSGCDTLLEALSYKDKEKSVKALLTLCLHIIQKSKLF